MIIFLAASLAGNIITECPFIRHSVNTEEKLDQIYLALMSASLGFVPALCKTLCVPPGSWAAAASSDRLGGKSYTMETSSSVQNFLFSVTQVEIALEFKIVEMMM